MQQLIAARQRTKSQPLTNWRFRFTAGRMRPKKAPVCASSRVYSGDALGVADIQNASCNSGRYRGMACTYGS